MSQALQRLEAPAPDLALAAESARPIPFGPDGRTRFSRNDYWKLVEIGLLVEGSPVELLQGEVVPMSPISTGHNAIIRRLNVFFAPKLTGRAIAASGTSIGIGNDSEPEPDYVVAKLHDDFYSESHALASDTHLLVEVSATSLEKDLGRKAELYARGGAPEYWVADLEHRALHVHRKPDSASGRWDEIVRLKPGAKVAPVAFPDAKLDLAWLFG